MKRICLWILATSFILAAAILFGWRIVGVSLAEREYHSISLGMTDEEVVSRITLPIPAREIGGPGREGYTSTLHEEGVTYFENDQVVSSSCPDGSYQYHAREDSRFVGTVRFWKSEPHTIVVVFSPNGRVIGRKLWRFNPPKQPTWFDGFLRWIQL